MTPAHVLLFLLGLCVGLLVVVRDWRPSLLLLLGALVASAIFIGQAIRQGREVLIMTGAGRLVMLDLVTATTVVVILLLTGRACACDDRAAGPGANGALDLPPAVFRGGRFLRPVRPLDYLRPIIAVVLMAAATLYLPRLYPYPSRDVDYAWTLFLLGGIILLVIADSTFKIGLGLLLLAFGLNLFYLAVVPRIVLVELALLHLVAIIVALVIAYLSTLARAAQDARSQADVA